MIVPETKVCRGWLRSVCATSMIVADAASYWHTASWITEPASASRYFLNENNMSGGLICLVFVKPRNPPAGYWNYVRRNVFVLFIKSKTHFLSLTCTLVNSKTAQSCDPSLFRGKVNWTALQSCDPSLFSRESELNSSSTWRCGWQI